MYGFELNQRMFPVPSPLDQRCRSSYHLRIPHGLKGRMRRIRDSTEAIYGAALLKEGEFIRGLCLKFRRPKVRVAKNLCGNAGGCAGRNLCRGDALEIHDAEREF
jgi:hypothetical protein